MTEITPINAALTLRYMQAIDALKESSINDTIKSIEIKTQNLQKINESINDCEHDYEIISSKIKDIIIKRQEANKIIKSAIVYESKSADEQYFDQKASLMFSILNDKIEQYKKKSLETIKNTEEKLLEAEEFEISIIKQIKENSM